MHNLTLEAADGYRLAASLFSPAKPNGLAIVINSATGAPRRYYQAFARYLSHRGATVLTFDYRGIGDSLDHRFDLAGLRIRDWGAHDFDAAVRWLLARVEHQHLAVIGHSIGGQLLGLSPAIAQCSAALTIASQIGYWRHWPGMLRQWQMRSIFRWAMPVVVKQFGKLPGFAMGGVSLPAGIALEWARWCQHPDYFVDEHNQPLPTYFHRFHGPIRLYSFGDDLFYAPPLAVTALAARFGPQQASVVFRQPADWQLAKLGHFGFFKSATPEHVWAETADWLESQTVARVHAHAA
ncbi:putative alpha/beta hydrolase [Chitinivorax tropicus]|uniref:Putative alpha/beta hydrolase n=1 Tax=Chitinivorax tropicus TaxID=714531 RepID=A0A840MK18_9PROT|nr:alpha/beta fold hydrolase [Chitinivorax tropicus]MBB5017177.1 putative alpha/beta hydrolase [Chitinivorax tropicus]